MALLADRLANHGDAAKVLSAAVEAIGLTEEAVWVETSDVGSLTRVLVACDLALVDFRLDGNHYRAEVLPWQRVRLTAVGLGVIPDEHGRDALSVRVTLEAPVVSIGPTNPGMAYEQSAFDFARTLLARTSQASQR